MAGCVGWAATTKAVVASVPYTHPNVEIPIRQGVRATKVGRCARGATTWDAGRHGAGGGLGIRQRIGGVGLQVADGIDGHWRPKAAMHHQWAGLAVIDVGGVFRLKWRDACGSAFQGKST